MIRVIRQSATMRREQGSPARNPETMIFFAKSIDSDHVSCKEVFFYISYLFPLDYCQLSCKNPVPPRVSLYFSQDIYFKGPVNIINKSVSWSKF